MKFFILVFLTIFIIGCVSGAPPSLEQSAKQQEHNSVNHPNGFNVNIIKFGRKGVVKPDYESLKIFLDPQVANRKLVIFSIVGAFRKGKSFFMDYCLRFMYANVSKNLKRKSTKFLIKFSLVQIIKFPTKSALK